MMMPKVSMNKMAMNESVATTCCYKVTQNSTNEYWEILHGGYIGQGWIYDVSWDALGSQMNHSMKAYPFDITPVSQATIDAIADIHPHKINGSWFVDPTFTEPDGDLENIYMTQWLYSEGLNQTACDHSNANCLYKSETRTTVTNYHWDATSAHGGIDKWSAGHAAARYSS